MCIYHAIDKHGLKEIQFFRIKCAHAVLQKIILLYFNVHGAFGNEEYQQILLTCGKIPFYKDTINFII